MTTNTKAKSRILEAVHETAADLHRLGFIDQRKMRKYSKRIRSPVDKPAKANWHGKSRHCYSRK